MPVSLLTTREAAERLGVHVTRVLAYCRSGRLPARQLGREWAIAERDVARFTKPERGRPRDVRPPQMKRQRGRPRKTETTG